MQQDQNNIQANSNKSTTGLRWLFKASELRNTCYKIYSNKYNTIQDKLRKTKNIEKQQQKITKEITSPEVTTHTQLQMADKLREALVS